MKQALPIALLTLTPMLAANLTLEGLRSSGLDWSSGGDVSFQVQTQTDMGRASYASYVLTFQPRSTAAGTQSGSAASPAVSAPATTSNTSDRTSSSDPAKEWKVSLTFDSFALLDNMNYGYSARFAPAFDIAGLMGTFGAGDLSAGTSRTSGTSTTNGASTTANSSIPAPSYVASPIAEAAFQSIQYADPTGAAPATMTSSIMVTGTSNAQAMAATAASSGVPEPATGIGIAGGLVALLAARRKFRK